MNKLTVKASELRVRDVRLSGLVINGEPDCDDPICKVVKINNGCAIEVWFGWYRRAFLPDDEIHILRPDPEPDPLTVLREWVQAGHDACMAAGCSRLYPEFRSDNGGWVVVNTDDLLAKIAELEQR